MILYIQFFCHSCFRWWFRYRIWRCSSSITRRLLSTTRLWGAARRPASRRARWTRIRRSRLSFSARIWSSTTRRSLPRSATGLSCLSASSSWISWCSRLVLGEDNSHLISSKFHTYCSLVKIYICDAYHLIKAIFRRYATQ